MGEREDFKEEMKAKFAKMKELGIVDIDEEMKKVVINADSIIYGKAKAEDDSHTALVLRLVSNETPFSMFFLIAERDELRRLKNAIDVVLNEDTKDYIG